ncbi:unnamed protein product [Echinostoma caproni]|uniref:SH3 domain-containing protein n=1 Tax=Echinostoma caproni TaxID=27848 RepID=A0A183AB82_9TREM|nr:unnamed protein product [Echinostoma caproni]
MIGVEAGAENGWFTGNSCSQVMDHIMRVYVDSSLGLNSDNAVSKLAPTPSPGAQSPNVLDEALSEATPVKPTGLTLEQKRQLAAEQTQRERLQAQQSLAPVSQTQSNRMNTPSKPVPRDLTSTLIDSNLASMTQRPVVMNTPSPALSGIGLQPPLMQPSGFRPLINPSGFLTLQQDKTEWRNRIGDTFNFPSYLREKRSICQ